MLKLAVLAQSKFYFISVFLCGNITYTGGQGEVPEVLPRAAA